MSCPRYEEPKSSDNPSEWVSLLYARRLPCKKDITSICTRMIEILTKEKNILSVQEPVTLVGDIHGQFFDLLELFSVAGKPPSTSFLFLGDYVDRGHYSVETLLLLFCLKIKFGDKIHLLRGNHETRQITQVYGFYDECLVKFGSSEAWKQCCEVFDCLPLAALIGKGTSMAKFAVHAGLTPVCETLDQIETLHRVHEVPHEGAMCDLVWSDPEDVTGWAVSPRGAGFVFGGDVVEQFNRTNGIQQVCRSHQLVMTGYKELFNAQLVTIWSAPNYCYRCGNDGAVLEVDEDLSTNVLSFGPKPDEERETPEKDNKFATLPDYFL